MDFCVLGPLEVRDGGRSLTLGGPRQRAVLAFLLAHANEVVSADRLLEAAWGTQPPATRQAGLHVRISQLRKIVGAARIVTRPPGYVLVVHPGELDLERFELLASEGRGALAAGDPERALVTLTGALGLWRGQPLADVAFAASFGAVARLEELYWAAVELRIEAQLELGRHEEAVGELDELIAEQPLRERLREHSMMALYRSGRQAEALAAYRDARRAWVEELGIEPSRRLQRLERAILVQDASLDLPTAAATASVPYAGEERKLVTVLLADVIADDDLERTRSWLGRLREVAAGEIDAAGGTMEAIAGGGILAAFGAPAAQEDHVDRALRVAGALVDRLAGVVPLRVAVETGEVIVGRSGLSGPPISAAMRLLSDAAGGGVLVGRRAAAARARLDRVTHRAHSGLFVGRGGELNLLRSAYRGARSDARPRLVSVVADAGVGKSRLVREFLAELAAETPAPRCLTGRCLSYGRGVTYRALGDALSGLLGLHENDSRATILDQLAGREILGLTLGLDVAGDIHPLAAVERLRRAWVELLSELAARCPTVLVIGDLHWAQEDLLDLLDYLLDGVDGPLLLVVTARPELLGSRPSWGRRRDTTTVWLEPLAPEQAALLVEEAPAHLRRVLLERAEGNPFFIEELLARIRGGVDVDVSAVPDSVQAVLAARIDQLPALEKEALQAASVIGRAFWREPVRQLLGGASPSFEVLEERDFVRPRARSAFEGMRELAFKHALTREVVYASLPRARRARLHAGFARWLEEVGGGRDEHAAFLGHHYAEAVNSQDADLVWGDDRAELETLRASARAWLGRAADLAMHRYEIDEALALLHRALELEHDDDARCRLWRAIAQANALKFAGDAFWTAMETALELASDDATRADICSELAVEAFVRAGMWTSTPALEQVGGWITRAIELAQPGTPSRARALVATAFRDLDDADAAAEAASIAESLDDPELCIYAWDACGAVAMAGGDYEAAWRWRTRRLSLLERVTDPDLRTIIAETPYSACIATCRFDQARAIARLHDDLTRPLTPHHRLHGAAILVEVEELLGDWHAIREREDRVREAVAANAATPCLRNARSLLVCALAATYLGDAEAALELERAADALGLHGKQVLDAPRLRLALARGDHAHATHLLQRMEADDGWYARGHGTSLATLITRLDALSTLGYRDQAEREATPLLAPGTYVEPFALRAIGIVRGDREPVCQALARFNELALGWHAAQTESLLRA